ncbi:aldehyde dehydrogenase family protein [Pseudomonas sp. L-22-4S-12]|uniref:aldehyde dehydrogenase family protein n=1 Tax=Pseudomonas sp. L-22-4S-12 TaxID=2610893 RepID=UPI001323612F|nr:aldehyde dehydrogenase family protein [Pseudomonas sp. L-22-4S-12]MWV16350.1 aldehyde dehydrogenase family protein [Pseudomonas sp. L-22-4S-12]
MNSIRLISPVDGSLYAERPHASSSQLEQALAEARQAQRAWRELSIEQRAGYCLKAVDAMLAMSDEIVPELAWQMGRPVRYGAGELRGFEERARYMVGIAARALADVVPPPKEGFRRYVRREPLGTVLVIAPWNYPYLTAVNAIIPALMAGNAVLLKHASQTLLVGERFALAFERAGLPHGLFRNLVLDHGQTATLIASGHVQQVNFTGSVEGGRLMESAAAGHFIGVGLELGGKDPAYVRGDANLAHAVENLVDGSFFNSGQSCCGIERIYVDQALYPAFVEGFVELTKQYVLGNPLQEATTLGPLVRSEAAEFVRGQIAEARAKGAKALIEAKSFAADAPGSAYLAPQVLVQVNHDMAVMRQESFGPVVGIMPVAGDAEAIALMNDSPYGLSAAIWSSDLEAAERIGQQLDTGTVFMNRCDYLDPALAWTGVKHSGRGATLSSLGYEHLTRPKSFHLRHQL